jgi:hypothetical protein
MRSQLLDECTVVAKLQVGLDAQSAFFQLFTRADAFHNCCESGISLSGRVF